MSENKMSQNRNWLSDLIKKHDDTDNLQLSNQCHGAILHDKALIVAPMVEQSDLPFRLLCRKYGANLACTPMIHARYFVTKQSYRDKMWKNPNDLVDSCDRPLIAQLCGSNKEILLEAAKIMENHVDAIDLNCGCPTKTARRGRYGAFLLQSDDFLVDIVRYLAKNLSCPLTVKVRLLADSVGQIDMESSLQLYEKLVDAGIGLLTVHGRTRFQKGEATGKANWDAIRQVVEAVGGRIPVIANGNIQNLDDVRDCLLHTKADGIMSSESILEYPPLFQETNTKIVNYDRVGPGRLQIAREYLDFCVKHPPENGGGGTGMQCIRMHLDVFLHEDWKEDPQLRHKLLLADDIDDIYQLINELKNIHQRKDHKVQNEQLSWYMRHR